MKQLITSPVGVIQMFVSERLGHRAALPWGQSTVLGLASKNRLVAGVIYNHFSSTNCCMHVAAVDGRQWLTPEFLFAAFDYPFNALGLQRVTGLVPEGNAEARRFDEHLGFKLEGKMRNALPAGEGMLVYGMLREECRWISNEFSERVWKRLQMRSIERSAAVH